MPMDDYYQEESADKVIRHEDHDLFEQEVIAEDEDLLLVHTLLDEVFRGVDR